MTLHIFATSLKHMKLPDHLFLCVVDSWHHVQVTSTNQSTELEVLRAQVARLQAEKNDLVALNSELQLKADQDSQDDGSFIEIIRVSVQRTRVRQRSFSLSPFQLYSYSYLLSGRWR